jgi:hypothetical protein
MTGRRTSSARTQAIEEEPVTSVLPNGDVPFYSNHDLTADEEERVLAIHHALRKLCGLGPTPKLRLYAVLWHGICRDRWYDLGMAYRYDWNPMCCDEHGRAV